MSIGDVFFSKGSDSDDGEESSVMRAERQLAAAILSRSIVIERKHNISFADVVGLEKAKRALKKSVEFPMKYPSLMEGITPWQAILLFGVSLLLLLPMFSQ